MQDYRIFIRSLCIMLVAIMGRLITEFARKRVSLQCQACVEKLIERRRNRREVVKQFLLAVYPIQSKESDFLLMAELEL